MIAYAKQVLGAERSRNPPECSNGRESTQPTMLPTSLIVPRLETKILQHHAAQRVVNESRKYGGVLQEL